MHFPQTLAALVGFIACGHLATALPQNAGNGGFGPTNVCDQRGQPEVFDNDGPGPRVSSCKHLSELFRSQSIFGPQTQIPKGGRTFTSGDCSFIAECPVFQEGTPYIVGSDDLADLMDSAIEDFENAGGEQVSGISNEAHFVVDGENNVVSCEVADGSKKLINVKYTITSRTSGGTLPS